MRLLLFLSFIISLSLIPISYAEINPLEFVDIQINSIEKFEAVAVKGDGETYYFFKLNISMYEPEKFLYGCVAISEYSIRTDLCNFHLGHDGGYETFERDITPIYDSANPEAKYFRDTFDCDIELDLNRPKTYDLNLCYKNKLKENAQYHLRFSHKNHSVQFLIPKELTNFAVNDFSVKESEEKRLEEEKKKQYEEENPFRNSSAVQNTDISNMKDVPEWIKGVIEWYAEGKITQEQLFNMIKFLIAERILVES